MRWLPALLMLACGSSSSEGAPAAGDGGDSTDGGPNPGPSGASPVQLATGRNRPCLIAADDNGPVWLDDDGAYTIDSKTLATIKTVNLGGGIALTASDVYFMGQLDQTTTGIVKLSRVGGAPSLFIDRKNFPTALNPGPLGILGNDLYALSSSRPGPIYRLPLDGSAKKELTTTTFPQGLSLAGNGLYFVTSDTPSGGSPAKGMLGRIALDTGQVSTLDEGFFPGREVVSDGTETFFTTSLDINRHPKATNGSRNIAGAKTSGGLVMDGKYLYYGVEGKLVRLPRAGGQPETLATTTPCSIALAKSTLYWTVAAEGSVYAMQL